MMRRQYRQLLRRQLPAIRSWRVRSLKITYVRLDLGSDWLGVTLPYDGGVRLRTVIGDIHFEHVP
jgi:hypothetical protein